MLIDTTRAGSGFAAGGGAAEAGGAGRGGAGRGLEREKEAQCLIIR